jgi:hypothetical protein
LRNLLLVSIFISVIISFSTGCSHNKPDGTTSTTGVANGIKNEDQFIKAQKRVGNESNFEEFRKITNGKQVHKVKEILNELKWEYAKRDTLQPPDYQFVFQPKDPKVKVHAILYKIWITPDNDRLVIGRGDNQYALQLTKEQSEVLFEIISGEKLVK